MDNFLLESVVRELRPEAQGRRVSAVHQAPTGALLIVLEPPAGGGGPMAIVVESAQGRERLYRMRGAIPLLRSPAAPFAAAVAHRLTGRLLEEIRKEPSERVVVLRFSGAGFVAELIPRSGRLILLDGDGTIVGVDHPARGAAAERVRTGLPWAPPPTGDRPGVFDAGADLVRALTQEARHSGRPLATILRQSLRGLSDAVGHELERVAEAGGDPGRELDRWFEAFREGRFRPCLYSPLQLREMSFESASGADAFFALPLELAAPPPGLTVTGFPTASDAAEALYEKRLAGADFTARRDAVTGLLRREAVRLEKLASRLQADLAKLPSPGTTRRQAEALLAGLNQARRHADHVLVPDPWSEDPASEVAIPAPPGRPLQTVAADLFRREAKAARTREAVGERLTAAETRGRAAGELAAAAADARDVEGLDRVSIRLKEFGFVFLPERKLRRGRGPGSGRASTSGGGGRGEGAVGAAGVPASGRLQPAGVRRYESEDGLEILVGRTARDNDRLTFRIAEAEDFWLHAAGTPGAHVVVRNPGRIAHLPEKTLRQAAGLAAWFSRAAGPEDARPPGRRDSTGRDSQKKNGSTGKGSKGGGKIEVHVSRRKHVKKARGAPPGTVLLKRFTSIFVAPVEPRTEGEV